MIPNAAIDACVITANPAAIKATPSEIKVTESSGLSSVCNFGISASGFAAIFELTWFELMWCFAATGAVTGSDGVSSAAVRWTQAAAASCSVFSTGNSNFGFDFGRGLCARALEFGDSVLRAMLFLCFTVSGDEVNQRRIILRGATAGRIFPDRLGTCRRIVEIDALPDPWPKHWHVDCRIRFECVQSGFGRVICAVYEGG